MPVNLRVCVCEISSVTQSTAVSTLPSAHSCSRFVFCVLRVEGCVFVSPSRSVSLHLGDRPKLRR